MSGESSDAEGTRAAELVQHGHTLLLEGAMKLFGGQSGRRSVDGDGAASVTVHLNGVDVFAAR